jgi:NADH-quinone oxidoreductase subunit L
MLGLIPLFPLVGFLINGLWYGLVQSKPGARKAGAAVTGGIATAAIFASFIASLVFFLQLKGMPEDGRMIHQTLFSWMAVGDAFKLDMAFHLDSLSTLFTLVITGVGTLIHLYSIGYMGHDATPGKFFAYLNLFCFAMLMLVLGASLPIMFLGWEGVGLCSYLLIGYWYTDEDKAQAGKKAFIANRVGDFGFLLGMFLIFTTFGSMDFEAIRAAAMAGHGALPVGVSAGTITAICLLLFVGCTGKSAQIPLYVWLPDAMAGPTPVSALIHAATMVTSGIYLISRLNFLYTMSPDALHVVAVIGAATAFFAATIALAQRDIKKVLAYSTVSQLGYMFLACGVGAYVAGVFHVITHAFFKALLFLGAGSVIHGMHEEQDMLKMGGLRSKMPKTFLVFGAAWLAISGVPPFSGFFSKDEILFRAFSSEHGSVWLWLVGVVTAGMTAFYMTRAFSLTFLGTPRFDEKKLGAHGAAAHGHDDHGHGHVGVHESPTIMTVPLQILAVLAVIGGFIGLPHMSWLEHWLEPVIPAMPEAAGGAVSAGTEYGLMFVSVAIAVVTILATLKLYRNLERVEAIKARFAWAYKLLENKWYIDELYDALVVRPVQALARGLWKGFDVGVIDWIVNGFGRASTWTGQTVRVIQTGSMQVYAFMILLGLVATVGYLIYGLV